MARKRAGFSSCFAQPQLGWIAFGTFRAMSPEDLEATAYHEAGHAVMQLLRDVPFEHVEVREEGERLGIVCAKDPNLQSEQFRDQYRLDHARICFAGPAAETIQTGRPSPERAST